MTLSAPALKDFSLCENGKPLGDESLDLIFGRDKLVASIGCKKWFALRLRNEIVYDVAIMTNHCVFIMYFSYSLFRKKTAANSLALSFLKIIYRFILLY